jgi:hypothetical protein
MGRHHSKKFSYSGIEMKEEAKAVSGCCGVTIRMCCFAQTREEPQRPNRSNNIDRKPLLR